jgi:hypothetical protein
MIHHMTHSLTEASPNPFFSPEEFRTACLSLAESYRCSGTEARWTSIKVAAPHIISNRQDSGYFSVQQTLNPCKNKLSGAVEVEYHVILSPTWRLPVLYFVPMWSKTQEPFTLKEVYDFLVDKSSKGSLEDVGIMGGISHGVRMLKWYF